jgi:hypothetical protein
MPLTRSPFDLWHSRMGFPCGHGAEEVGLQLRLVDVAGLCPLTAGGQRDVHCRWSNEHQQSKWSAGDHADDGLVQVAAMPTMGLLRVIAPVEP